jgi:hypothetical protein
MKEEKAVNAWKGKVIQGAGPWVEGGYSEEKTPPPKANVSGSPTGIHIIDEKIGEVGNWIKEKAKAAEKWIRDDYEKDHPKNPKKSGFKNPLTGRNMEDAIE